MLFCELKLVIIYNLSRLNANRDLNTVLLARVCDKTRASDQAKWHSSQFLRLFVRILVFQCIFDKLEIPLQLYSIDSPSQFRHFVRVFLSYFVDESKTHERYRKSERFLA